MKFKLIESFEEPEINYDGLCKIVYNKVASLSEDELIKYGGCLSSTFGNGPSYITPSGKIIDVSALNVDSDLVMHLEWCYQLAYNVALDLGYNYPTYDICGVSMDVKDKVDDNLNHKGWIHVNTGALSTDERFYSILPDRKYWKIKEVQLDAFEKFLQLGIDSVILFFGESIDEKKYSFSKYTPTDIVDIVRDYYRKGEIIETIINNNEEELSDDQEKFFKYSQIRAYDGSGKLLPCYHASNVDFRVFDKAKIGSGSGGLFGLGFYFTPDKGLADTYGSVTKKYYLNIKNPFHYYNADYQDIVEVLKASGEKYDSEELEKYKDFAYSYADFLDVLNNIFIDVDSYTIISKVLQKLGYDGIIADEEIVAFEPNQIKLTTNKHPTDSDDINETVE